MGGIIGGIKGMAKEVYKPVESGKGKMDGDIFKQIGGNPASMKDDSYSGHEMLVEKMKGDYVYLRNPWGDIDRSNFGTDRSDTSPRRKVENNGPHPGGVVVMNKDDFYGRLKAYHIQRQSLIERFFGSR